MCICLGMCMGVYVCMYNGYMCVRECVCKWRADNNLWESGIFIVCILEMKAETHVFWLGGKHFYILSHI